MNTLMGDGLARAAIAVAVLWSLACIAFAGWNVVRNPMDARKSDLDTRLSRIVFVPEELAKPENAPLSVQRAAIVKKEAIWRPLVAAPTAAPPPEAKPDLLEKLKGVTASRRDQIRVGDSLKIKIHMNPEDKRGRWITVGDKVNGLVVMDIKEDTVVFSLDQGGKQFTAELPRR